MNKIFIGKKVSRKKLFITFLITIFISALFSNFLTIIFNRQDLFLVLFIFFLVVIFLIYIPIVSASCKYWYLEDKKLVFLEVSRYIDELHYAFDIILGKETNFTFELNLNEIKAINVYWSTQLYIWSTKNYNIMLGIESNDGSFLTFEALTGDTKDFIKAMNYLSVAKKIKINDPYRLLDAMRKDKNLYTYIDGVCNCEKGE
ncbi:MAG: hypothetical protein K2L08_01975 [Erysipelotrichaceae bacterium]|nr:hypothetical protein [Erysipelotrichaceae bacterium]